MTRLVLSPSLLAINRHLAVVKPSARDRGEAAREAGNAFEREVRAVFEGLHARGVVKHWTWTGPPSKYVWREGRLELVPTGPAPCDIVGVLPDARGFVAEVKHEADGLVLHPGGGRFVGALVRMIDGAMMVAARSDPQSDAWRRAWDDVRAALAMDLALYADPWEAPAALVCTLPARRFLRLERAECAARLRLYLARHGGTPDEIARTLDRLKDATFDATG